MVRSKEQPPAGELSTFRRRNKVELSTLTQARSESKIRKGVIRLVAVAPVGRNGTLVQLLELVYTC